MSNTKDIEDALVALLQQVTKERARGEARRQPANRITLTPFVFTPADKIKSRAEEAVDRMLERPVEEACLWAIRLLGHRLHNIGIDVDGMLEVAERVSRRSRRHGPRWYSIISSRWNCVGDWSS